MGLRALLPYQEGVHDGQDQQAAGRRQMSTRAPRTRRTLRHVDTPGGHLSYFVDEPLQNPPPLRPPWQGRPVPAVMGWTDIGECRGYLLADPPRWAWLRRWLGA